MGKADDRSVVAEVTEAHRRYEQALLANDVDTLTELFWDDPRTIRYGVTENLYGAGAIAAYRAAKPPEDLDRAVLRSTVTALGPDTAITAIEFQRLGSSRIGRQMQTWIRTSAGWRIAAAHVSFLVRSDSS
jgi:hypothetical protein